jgi:hypothetical protein
METAHAIGVPLLGRLPIDPEIARLCDGGSIEAYPAEEFSSVAEAIAAKAIPARAPIFPVR